MNMLCGKQRAMGSLEPKTGAQNLSRVEGRVLSQNTLAVAAAINRTDARTHHEARDRAGAWAARGWEMDPGARGVEENSLSAGRAAGVTGEAADWEAGWGHSKCGM